MERHVLIVDDDAGLTTMLSFFFEDAGYQVTGVGSCREALEGVARRSFSLILLDYQLPDGTGIDVLDALRGAVDPPPPVVMMSGVHDAGIIRHALHSGAREFLLKPLNARALNRALQRLPAL